MQAHHIVAKTMRMLAIQYTWEMRKALGIEGTGAADCTALFTGLLDACFQRFSMERLNDRAYRIGIDTFNPFDDDAPEALREAMFEFQRMAVRVTNGRNPGDPRAPPGRGRGVDGGGCGAMAVVAR